MTPYNPLDISILDISIILSLLGHGHWIGWDTHLSDLWRHGELRQLLNYQFMICPSSWLSWPLDWRMLTTLLHCIWWSLLYFGTAVSNYYDDALNFKTRFAVKKSLRRSTHFIITWDLFPLWSTICQTIFVSPDKVDACIVNFWRVFLIRAFSPLWSTICQTIFLGTWFLCFQFVDECFKNLEIIYNLGLFHLWSTICQTIFWILNVLWG